MRKTVCKRLRKLALVKAPAAASPYKGLITRFMTNKRDAKGKQIVIDRTTILCTGQRRAYQDLKRDYRRSKAI